MLYKGRIPKKEMENFSQEKEKKRKRLILSLVGRRYCTYTHYNLVQPNSDETMRDPRS